MVVLREARSVDAPAIARVHIDAWRSAYAGLLPDEVLVRLSPRMETARWARVLAPKRNRDTVLVAELGERGVVAFGSCGRTREPRLPHAGEIFTLYVHPEDMGKGIGRALFGHLLDALLARRMNSAVVWVLAENPARFFYEGMGGKRVAQRDETLWGSLVHQVAYGWNDLSEIRARATERKAR